ncbi:MAG TPA: hypothetical protein VFV38_05255 [Ktedonobacteraceae bacterium]|nr:hypothetical protein [Ktedonobacteraceae bacterium]
MDRTTWMLPTQAVMDREEGVQSLKTGNVRREVISGISSLSMKRVPPRRLLRLNRDHWGIENRLHWRRDVTLGEDRCQTRTGTRGMRNEIISSMYEIKWEDRV